MDQAVARQLRSQLETRRQELMRVIIDTEQQVRDQISSQADEPRVDFNHPADMVQGDPDYEKEIALAERQRGELALVMHALRRLNDGDYGHCESCGDEIQVQRLLAVPYTRFCLRCQAARERSASPAASQAFSP